jgi:hypothetical protein
VNLGPPSVAEGQTEHVAAPARGFRTPSPG